MADTKDVQVSIIPVSDLNKPVGTMNGIGATKSTGVAAGEGTAATYKIIKVRKPDGTIVRVKRPIVLDPQTTSAPDTAADPVATTTTKPIAKQTTTAAPSTTQTAKPAVAQTTANASSASPEPAISPSTAATPIRKPASATTVHDSPPTSIPTTTTAPTASAAATTHISPATHHTPAIGDHGSSSSRRFLRAFATKAAVSLTPSLIHGLEDIGQLHEHDEIIYDDDHDSDGYDDDSLDDAVDHGGTNHENADHDAADHDAADQHQSAYEHHPLLGTSLGKAGAGGLTAGLKAQQAPPPAYQRRKSGDPSSLNEAHVTTNETRGDAKGQTIVNEKNTGHLGGRDDADTRSLHTRHADWTRYVIWLILITFPLLFIVLGMFTAMLPFKDFNGTYATSLSQATKVAISTWPIVFAALAAQALRTFASYMVERGIRLMTLEQLMGSNSVAGAIKQPFLLRRFDLVTVLLLLLWSVSPLATQAMQRMSFPGSAFTYPNTTVWYLNTWTANHVFADKITDPTTVSYGTIIKDFFDASVLPQGQNAFPFMDDWFRPKIPILEYLPASAHVADGWWDITSVNDTIDYSSNYGIPLENMAMNGIYNFTITSSYLSFRCSDLTNVTSNQFSVISSGLPLQTYADPITNWSIASVAITPLSGNTPGSVFWANQLDENDNFLYSICHFTQTFVDSFLVCDNRLANAAGPGATITSPDLSVPPTMNSPCFVDRMRQNTSSLPNTTMGDFTVGFMSVVGSTMNYYLYNDTSIVQLANNGTFNINQVSTLDFTKRLARLINTYWQLGFGPTVQASGLNHQDAYKHNATTNDALAVVTKEYAANAISVAWIATYFLCAAVMLATAAASIILDTLTIVPDMLGYASTLARKSRYVDLPKVNSSMSGAERARILGDHRVMMQDVRPQASVGKVALGTAHPSAKRLEKGRDYR